ncbi:hypothetical protein [Candidatus Leptofilum sp.]|uniref:hypothetical protein n=1 Tax=Candidatus Leptofilum sp. TaxID=3241576 RepID=UPI003B5A0FD7
MKTFTLITLIILGLGLVGCGSFNLEPVVEDVAEAVEDVAQRETPAASETPSEPDSAEAEPTEPAEESASETAPPKENARFMPDVRTFATETNAEWGAAFCPASVMPVCVRPYAIESLGDEQVLLAEVWGTGDTFAAASNNFFLGWQASDSDDNSRFGNDCGNTRSEASHFSAGFGYLVRICFNNLDERPQTIEMDMNGAGSNFTIPFVVGDDLEAVGGYDYLINAQALPIDEPFIVGAATVTIQAVEDLGDALRLDLSIAAPEDNDLLVRSPEWLVVGDGLAFFTVNSNGLRDDWDEGKMMAYERVGGKIEAGLTQTGSVVLSKSASQAGLLITYGPSNVSEKDSAIFLLNQ